MFKKCNIFLLQVPINEKLILNEYGVNWSSFLKCYDVLQWSHFIVQFDINVVKNMIMVSK